MPVLRAQHQARQEEIEFAVTATPAEKRAAMFNASATPF
jgi:hypothetical protein